MAITKFKNKNISSSADKGFVILFAVLISSIILLISVGMYNIISKEVVISSSARESQRAFYAADSALECALYVDMIGVGSPNPTTPFTINPAPGSRENKTFNCGGDDINSFRLLTPTTSTGMSNGYDFPYVFRHYNALNTEGGCSYVLVEKNWRGTDITVAETRITAVGFNYCIKGADGKWNIPDFNNPTLLERRLSTEYDKVLI